MRSRGMDDVNMDDGDRRDVTPDAQDNEVMDKEQLLEAEEEVNLEAFDVPLREWIAHERTHRKVQHKFRNFLISFT